MSESCRAQGLGDTGSPEALSHCVVVGVTSGSGCDATDTAGSSELGIMCVKGLFVPNTLHLDFFILKNEAIA